MSKVIGSLLFLILAGCASAPSATPHAVTIQFQDLGCAGDWPSNEPQQPTVVRADDNGTTTFQIRHPATCCLTAKSPTFSIHGESLEMRYEMYSPTGMAIMCDCDYRARFSFSSLPDSVKSASFSWSEHER